MILHITYAKYLKDYQVEVQFNDGRKGVANLENSLRGPVFASLRNKEEFAKVRLDKLLDTIAWPNGADLAPEYVYYKAFADDPKLQSLFREWGYSD